MIFSDSLDLLVLFYHREKNIKKIRWLMNEDKRVSTLLGQDWIKCIIIVEQ
jgi:hypothetical protein